MLTDKQERFCKEYIIDCNATQAYIRAGYSPKGADKLASRLMGNDGVRARVIELMAEKDAALIANADEVLRTLTSILRREQFEEVVVTLSERTPTVGENGKVRYSTIEHVKVVNTKPRLSDVNRAAELLGKRYGLFTDNVSVDMATPVIIDNVPQSLHQPKEDGSPNDEK